MSKQVISIGSHPDESNPDPEDSILTLTQPYTSLEELYPTVPKVQDAWTEDSQVVIQLSDRSDWQLIADLSRSEELSTLQILWWLGEMAQLWPELEKVNCRQSLLTSSNLRLDEDQSFGLGKLYLDPPDNPPTLRDLGQMWQQLFQVSEADSLGKLFAQMASGGIATAEQLRDELKNIAVREQSQSMSKVDQMESDDSDFDIEPTGMEPSEQMIYASQEDEMPTIVLPMQLLSLADAGFTDIGLQRNHNEDHFGIYTEIKKQENTLEKQINARGLYIVCDGMGGHAAGEVASAMAVENLASYFKSHWQDHLPDPETIRKGILLANNKIYQTNLDNSRSGSGRMGTTLVMVLVQNNKAAIAHVGDSRIYKFTRQEGVVQLTVDHEVGQREIQRGVEPEVAYARPDAFQLTQALGPRKNELVHPDVNFLELNEDTLLLLCTDGLSDNNLIENYGEEYLKPLISSRANLEQGLLQLVDFANEHNGHDNITGLIVRVKVAPNFEPSPLF